MATSKKKYKRLTNKQKEENKEVRQYLIEQGFVKPKPRLNRKKFAKEAKDEFMANMNTFDDLEYLVQAITWLLPHENSKVTAEEIGVCKVIKLTVEIKKWIEEKRKAGENKYNLQDLYVEVIQPISEA